MKKPARIIVRLGNRRPMYRHQPVQARKSGAPTRGPMAAAGSRTSPPTCLSLPGSSPADNALGSPVIGAATAVLTEDERSSGGLGGDNMRERSEALGAVAVRAHRLFVEGDPPLHARQAGHVVALRGPDRLTRL